MRGRVMSLYMAIFTGGTPLGAPPIGWVGDAWAAGCCWSALIATGIAAGGRCLTWESMDAWTRLPA